MPGSISLEHGSEEMDQITFADASEAREDILTSGRAPFLSLLPVEFERGAFVTASVDVFRGQGLAGVAAEIDGRAPFLH